MADDQRANFASTTLTLYRNNFGLFWRIMIPVAIIAILFDIGVFFRSANLIKEHFDTPPHYTATGSLNTLSGITPTISKIDSLLRAVEFPSEYYTSDDVKVTEFSPYFSWGFFPLPYVSAVNINDKTTWQWTLHFRTYEYTPLFLMLLALCPLSLIVARLSSDVPPDSTPLTAREAWRRIGKKAFTVLVAFVLFVLIVDVGNYIHIGMTMLIPSLMRPWLITYTIILATLTHFYFLVTLSLYNPCLILENRSIIGIFKRSHALVSSARWRFLWIYLLTGWIAAVFTSVLLGAILLLFSAFFSELAPIREALTPLKFLSLFVGGNVGVVLSKFPATLPTVLLLIVKGIITAFLVPIWAIVTTRLYLESVENIAEAK